MGLFDFLKPKEEPKLSIEELLELKKDEAKLPENLAAARAQFVGTILDTQDLRIVGDSYKKYEGLNEDFTSIYGAEMQFKVLYQDVNVGVVALVENQSHIKSIIQNAKAQIRDLSPVNKGEFYSHQELGILQITDMFNDFKCRNWAYIAVSLTTNNKTTITHYQLMTQSYRVEKVA